jgi:hypothetical protein
MSEPSPNGGNGRKPDGKFAKGNAGGPGNPNARRVGQIRQKLLAAVTDDALEQIMRTLVEQAKAGVGWAVALLLKYLIGPGPLADTDDNPRLPDDGDEPDALDLDMTFAELRELQAALAASSPAGKSDCPPLPPG